jgi:DNA/RNA endonuclease YhcR with UshA esterase domain
MKEFPFIRHCLCALALLGGTAISLEATAHHSGALFYTMGERISITGTVESFNFRNPHAIVILTVTREDGTVERWTCETSAPSALRRRGWNQQSLTAGETVTLDGVPARDGSLLMRITAVTKADGTQVGVSARMDD